MAYLKINDSHRSICDPEFDNLLRTVRTSLEESQKSLKKIDLRYLELKNKL